VRKSFLELPHIRQEDTATCTAACVRMVLAFFGREVAESEIGLLLGTTPQGTSFASLIRVEQLGFQVTLGTGTVADLRAVTDRGIPLITAVHTSQLPAYPLPPWVPHCVVVAGASRSHVAVYDPGSDRTPTPDLVPLPGFEAAWRARRYLMASLTPRGMS
jgi:ABC-type bacteriocin/lantibiotic exporter with double-glycine peptidase domain